MHLKKQKEIIKPFNAKPFVKWAGGKTQLLGELDKRYPIELKFGLVENYFEPFVGSGAVFFDIIKKYSVSNAYLFDINKELILVYQLIQKKANSLMEILHELQKKYLRLSEKGKEKYFYEVRDQYNQTRNNSKNNGVNGLVRRGAQMIFLNKTCYNGLFRLNKQGEFNVPFGGYMKPKILDEANLKAVSQALQSCEIKACDFEELKDLVAQDSFVYFDPPYRPISKTSSFTTYSENNFNDEDQNRLAALFGYLNKKGAKLMLSNSDPKNINPNDNFFDDLYKDFKIERVPASRMINCIGEKRGKINELIITNY